MIQLGPLVRPYPAAYGDVVLTLPQSELRIHEEPFSKVLSKVVNNFMETFTGTCPVKSTPTLIFHLQALEIYNKTKPVKTEDLFLHLIITTSPKKKPVATYFKQLRTEPLQAGK